VTTFDDISEILDGPAGWIVVGVVAVVIVWYAVDSVEDTIQQDLQTIECKIANFNPFDLL
jgi:hypothetical protein